MHYLLTNESLKCYQNINCLFKSVRVQMKVIMSAVTQGTGSCEKLQTQVILRAKRRLFFSTFSPQIKGLTRLWKLIGKCCACKHAWWNCSEFGFYVFWTIKPGDTTNLCLIRFDSCSNCHAVSAFRVHCSNELHMLVVLGFQRGDCQSCPCYAEMKPQPTVDYTRNAAKNAVLLFRTH